MKKYIWLIMIVICFTSFSIGMLYGRNSLGEPLKAYEQAEIELSAEEKHNEYVENENLININKASEEELVKLKGIGEVLAGRIVEYRRYNGEFETIDDIKNVTGIGEKLFSNIKDDITV